MADPGSSSPFSWCLYAALAVLIYRGGTAILLSAFHALPSLQRRRLLEEEAIADPRLAALLERPRALGMGLEFWNQVLLLLLVLLLWPGRQFLPGGAWTLAIIVLMGLWLLDLLLPALLASRDPALWLTRLYPLYAPAQFLLAPLVDPLARMIDRRHAQEKAKDDDDEETTEEAVTALLEEGEAEGIIEADDRELIRNVVSFGDTVVREVMTPRTRIVALSVTATIREAWDAFTESRHSRLPVYEGSIDQVRGVLLVKDLMQLPDGAQPPLSTLLKPPHFVPESKPVADLLRDLQRARTQLALVVDEFGGVSGLVTMEDLLEEVFGEIQDEHEASTELQEQTPGVWFVSGQAHVEDVAETLGVAWEREGFDTLAGLVMARLGRIPEPQESVAVEGALLTVLRMEGTRIVQVRVQRL
ncbi:hemolysin family protein [Geothrix sp. PMB-07]|uniref:hemolysin family protein n=1 Tax=Geothrix sp. PMB-07 TaxID=3068640 RepID=UPI0027416AE1|nr:hemolysin family protein [Geothrix sp. PMB-07]WLT32355.1 hemolysin family protein [Geothrix sp. PMB-07]